MKFEYNLKEEKAKVRYQHDGYCTGMRGLCMFVFRAAISIVVYYRAVRPAHLCIIKGTSTVSPDHHPSRHTNVTFYWFNAVPASQTVDQN